jgi:Reverse transcriptase (RNA-dependent DNA polymerase)
MEFGDSIVKLIRAQYGLVQSPGLWMATFSGILIDLGMRKHKSDLCLFVFLASGDTQGIILVYWDDCIMTGMTLVIRQLKKGICKIVTITEIGPFTYHLLMIIKAIWKDQ